MYQLNLSGSWAETKEKIKEADPNITDEMLAYEPGKEEELFKRLRAVFKTKGDSYIKDWIEAISGNSAKSG